MKKRKKVLILKKIKISNMNFIKGGGDTDSPATGINVCQSEVDCPPPNEASTPGNLCSDACVYSDICFTNQPDTRTIFMSEHC